MKQIKKKLVWILCMAVCLFSLWGCAAEEETAAGTGNPSIDSILIQQTQMFLEEIAELSDEDIQYIIDQGQEDPGLLSGFESYLSIRKDLGELVSTDEGGSASLTESGYEATIKAQFEKRKCEFTLGMEIDTSAGRLVLTSMSFNPEYTLGENMTKAALNTLMGMGTVFVVLIFISLLISCFKYINVLEKKLKERKSAPAAAAPAPAPLPVPAAEEEEDLTDDLELVAVITAAIAAASEHEVPADGLVVRSIRRVPGAKWKNA